MHGFDVCLSTDSAVPTYEPYQNQFKEIVKRKKAVLTPENKAAIEAGENEDVRLVRYFRYDSKKGARAADPAEIFGDDSKLIMDNALSFMEQSRRNNQPFFIVMWFHTPHNPCYSSPESLKLYRGKYKNFDQLKSEFKGRFQQYAGCSTDMDRQIGVLRSALRSWGIENNTMLTFSSDNAASTANGGENFPFSGYKGELWEGGIRVPSLLEWPSKIDPRTDETMAITNDYYKTVLDVVGLKDPQNFDNGQNDGVSLKPLFRNVDRRITDRPRGGLVFAHSEFKSFISQNYKLLYVNYNKKNEQAYIFDMRNNPSEDKAANLINNPEYKSEVKKMNRHIKEALREWSISSDKNKATGK